MVSKACGTVKSFVQTVRAKKCIGSTKNEFAAAGCANGRPRAVLKNGGTETVIMVAKTRELKLICFYLDPRQAYQNSKMQAGVGSRKYCIQVYGFETSRIDF